MLIIINIKILYFPIGPGQFVVGVTLISHISVTVYSSVHFFTHF